MFGKNLSLELKQYLRWLWPFMLGAVGTVGAFLLINRMLKRQAVVNALAKDIDD